MPDDTPPAHRMPMSANTHSGTALAMIEATSPAGSRWPAARRQSPSISAATAASWSAARCRTSSRGSPAVSARFHAKQKTLRDRVGDRQHCRSGHAVSPSPSLLPDEALADLVPSGAVFKRHVFFFFQRRSPPPRRLPWHRDRIPGFLGVPSAARTVVHDDPPDSQNIAIMRRLQRTLAFCSTSSIYMPCSH